MQKRTIFLLIFFTGLFLPFQSAFAVTGLEEGQATPKGIYKCQWQQKENSNNPNEGTCVSSSASNCQPNFKDKCDIVHNKFACEIVSGACVSSTSGGSNQPGGSEQPGGSNQPSGSDQPSDFQIQNPLKAGTVPEILDTIARFLFNIALAFVTIMVLWGGLQILTAAGSPTQIDKGKKTLLYAVIGTVVILVAGGIANLTANILGGNDGSSVQTGDRDRPNWGRSIPQGGTKPPLLPE